MKIIKIENCSLGYAALEFLYDEATKNSGGSPSDEIEQAYHTLLEIEQAHTELEELKRDVARYLELQQKFEKANFSFVKEQDKQEYFRLNQKLSKVGKELNVEDTTYRREKI